MQHSITEPYSSITERITASREWNFRSTPDLSPATRELSAGEGAGIMITEAGNLTIDDVLGVPLPIIIILALFMHH